MKEETKRFELKDNVDVEGVTEDFVWYHADLLSTKMRSFESNFQRDFKRLVSVMEARHKEHLSIIDKLMRENSILRFELARLKEKSDGKSD